MNINKASWHYEFLKEWGPGQKVPTDLCRYVRTLIIMPCLLIAIGIGAGLLAMSILVFPIITIHIFWADLPYWAVINDETFAIMGLMIWLSTTAVLIFVGSWELLQRYLRYRRGLSPKAPQPPNLFLEYYRATKAKICPILRFKE